MPSLEPAGTVSQAPLKVLFASPEALPYYKSGGLADVARALPDALRARGHDIRIIHPLYSAVRERELHLREHTILHVPWVGGSIEVRSYLHEVGEGAPGVLVDHHAFATNGSPYDDADPLAAGRRFALFARAVVGYARWWQADVVHLNDWQTGLVPVYALLDDITLPTVFAIHNLAYQGLFARGLLDEIGIPQDLFRIENGLEFHGSVAFIKGGLALADRLVTVSPTYAQEIQTHEYGAGFDGLLHFRNKVLHGILNGIDTRVWDPATDSCLYHTYDVNTLDRKADNKRQLLSETRISPARPLLVTISRLAHQKGVDLILRAVPELLDMGAALVVLGEGERGLQMEFTELARRYPDRVAAVFRFDEMLAHRLYAAGDFFLMPSRYEPCGLGQMIAQRYGTPPIVRTTGGLRDTVIEAKTGFCFEDARPEALVEAVQRALWVRDNEAAWDIMRQRCMALDWSWAASAAHYEDVYRYALGPPAG